MAGRLISGSGETYTHTKPTMITMMLGMNDGYYRPLDPGIFSTYADGYRRIVDQFQANLRKRG